MANVATLKQEIEERGKPTVVLSGQDGNSFMILGLCDRALRRARFSTLAINEFLDEAESGDYDHLLQTAMTYLDVD